MKISIILFNRASILAFLSIALTYCMEMPPEKGPYGIERNLQTNFPTSLYTMNEHAGLIIACNLDDLELAEHLLQANANPIATNYQGNFALRIAVESKNIALIKLLLKYVQGDCLDSNIKNIIAKANKLVHKNEINTPPIQEQPNNGNSSSIGPESFLNFNTSDTSYINVEIEMHDDHAIELTSLNVVKNLKRKASSDQLQLQNKNNQPKKDSENGHSYIRAIKKLVKKRYACNHPECNRSFKKLDSLVRHKIIHTGKRIHACNYPGCSKSFYRAYDLKRHKKIHMA